MACREAVGTGRAGSSTTDTGSTEHVQFVSWPLVPDSRANRKSTGLRLGAIRRQVRFVTGGVLREIHVPIVFRKRAWTVDVLCCRTTSVAGEGPQLHTNGGVEDFGNTAKTCALVIATQEVKEDT